MQMHIGPLVIRSARPAPAATAVLVSIAGMWECICKAPVTWDQPVLYVLGGVDGTILQR